LSKTDTKIGFFKLFSLPVIRYFGVSASIFFVYQGIAPSFPAPGAKLDKYFYSPKNFLGKCKYMGIAVRGARYAARDTVGLRKYL
jgi:hypothetical protein